MAHETPLDLLNDAFLGSAQKILATHVERWYPDLVVRVAPLRPRGMSDYIRLGLPRFDVFLIGSSREQRKQCLELLRSSTCVCFPENGRKRQDIHTLADHLEGGRGTGLEQRVKGAVR